MAKKENFEEVSIGAEAPKVGTEKKKKTKKLSKVINGNVLTITEAVTGAVLTFDAGSLPEAIQANLMPYGLSQKLGDAAAGKEGQEAVDSINKVWEGLSKGDWSVRAPAGEKITKQGLVSAYEEMEDGPQKDAMKSLLVKLNVIKA